MSLTFLIFTFGKQRNEPQEFWEINHHKTMIGFNVSFIQQRGEVLLSVRPINGPTLLGSIWTRLVPTEWQRNTESAYNCMMTLCDWQTVKNTGKGRTSSFTGFAFLSWLRWWRRIVLLLLSLPSLLSQTQLKLPNNSDENELNCS